MAGSNFILRYSDNWDDYPLDFFVSKQLMPLKAHVWIEAIGRGAVAYALSSHLSIHELCRMIALCKETRRAFSSQAIWRVQAARLSIQVKDAPSIYEVVRDFRITKFQEVASLIVPSYVTFQPCYYDSFLPHLHLFIRAGLDEHVATLLAHQKNHTSFYVPEECSQYKCLLAASLHRRFDLFHHFDPKALNYEERNVLLQVLDPEFDSEAFYEMETNRYPAREIFYPLPQGPKPSDEDIACILYSGRIECTLSNAKILSHFGLAYRSLLCKVFEQLEEEARVEMVKHALSRDSELAKVLILQCPFSIGAQEQILEAVCRVGAEGLLRECLGGGWGLSSLNRELCVTACAGGSGNPNLMRFLLSRGDISYGMRSLAFARAASNGYIEVIKELRPSLLQPKQRAQVILAALREHAIEKSVRINIALLLLNTGLVEAQDSFNIISAGARIGSFEVLSYFDLKGLTKKQRGQAVIQAGHGHLEMMVAIRDSGEILSADFEEATLLLLSTVY